MATGYEDLTSAGNDDEQVPEVQILTSRGAPYLLQLENREILLFQ